MQWRIELLGGLRLQRLATGQTFDRFCSRRAASLLAFLAYEPRPYPRELLAEVLWPGHDSKLARAHLRVVLLSLRRLLEPPGVPLGSVLLTDRHCIGLQPGAVTTDVAAFKAALQGAELAADAQARLQQLAAAIALYHGPLLPGYYEDWVAPAAQALQDAFFVALRQLITHLEAVNEWSRAVNYAQMGIAFDPLREDAQRDLMRLYLIMGQPTLALRQHDELSCLLRQRLNVVPDPATRELRRQIEGALKANTPEPKSPAHTLLSPPQPEILSYSSPGDTAAPLTALSLRLPLYRTRCYGRQEEIIQLRRLLLGEGRRLITLTGPGGCGKTRLVVECVRAIESEWPGPIYFVPLADLNEARLIPAAIADAMRLPRAASHLESVAKALNAAVTPLLILDNLEHLLPDATPTLQWLLGRVASLRLLLTSRQELRLADECLFTVPLLSIPNALAVPSDPQALLGCASVQLFYDRAQAARPGFRLTKHNVAAVAKLCARLEGLPLALELAATQAGHHAPGQLLTRFEHCLDFSIAQPSIPAYRYPTLRAALEWSYEPLWLELKNFFMGLGVFRGGFTVKSAAAVRGESCAAHYLEQLRLASLIIVEEQASGTRFRLLETVREFALELLKASGAADEIRRQHASYFLELAEAAYPNLLGSTEQVAWLERLEQENDNLRAALAWLAENDPATHLRLAVTVTRFWRIAGRDVEVRDLLQAALQRGAAAPVATRIVALREMGEVLLRLGEWGDEDNYQAARQYLEESACLSRQAGDLQNLACTLRKLGEGAQYAAHDMATARVCFEESLAIERERGEPFTLGAALHYCGSVARDSGDFKHARALYEESAATFGQIDNPYGRARALTHLAALSYLENNPPLARTYWEKSLPLFRDLNDKAGRAWALRYLSGLAQEHGDLEAAQALLEERVALNRELGNVEEVRRAQKALEKVGEMQFPEEVGLRN